MLYSAQNTSSSHRVLLLFANVLARGMEGNTASQKKANVYGITAFSGQTVTHHSQF